MTANLSKYAAVAVGILVLLGGAAAIARPVQNWTEEKLTAEADLVVIASAKLSKDEAADRSNAKPDSWVGVETEMKVSAALKGKVEGGALTVRHDRYFDPAMSVAVVDGPGFVEFDTVGQTQYLLFLKRREDGRYEAVSGRMDPHFSVKEVSGYRHPAKAATPKAAGDGAGTVVGATTQAVRAPDLELRMKSVGNMYYDIEVVKKADRSVLQTIHVRTGVDVEMKGVLFERKIKADGRMGLFMLGERRRRGSGTKFGLSSRARVSMCG